MTHALLLSVIAVSVYVPIRTSRDPRPLRGLLRAVVAVAAFNLLYATGLSLGARVFYP